MSLSKKYILWFAQEHVEFRAAEFNSLMRLFNIPQTDNIDDKKPFWTVEFPDDAVALQYASRSIALRAIFKLWSHGKNYEIFHKNLNHFIEQNQAHQSWLFKPETSFKITVETYNKHLSQREKIARIESLDYLPLKGVVDLQSPKVEWWYAEFWGLDPTDVPNKPEDIFFGRWLANGQRHLIKEISLKNRKFIGNTSMDAQLSLLMANQALVEPGNIVFDPFVGTGSLLVSAAKFGGYVLGADIDFMMLHARARPSRITQRVREKDESVRANLEQYNCSDRYLDVVVADFSNTLWRNDLKFDSIITDPPYGIREATEKVETKPNKMEINKSTNLHYPSTSHYALHHLYEDLLMFASKHLKLGGRLVFWLPFCRDDYTDDIVPQHASLTLISNSEQILMGRTSRRLLTYEKHVESNHLLYDKEKVILHPTLTLDFRDRYFESDDVSRSEKRMHKAKQREQGRLEALKRGKVVTDGRSFKCTMNRQRFKEIEENN
uniref:tRNA (guanine(10)-N(2))-methyltransferase TRMT11 n=1 Tax=Glossina morsitans morsitans TaxID=37546 RepID=A0A1B0ERY9_GLOMM